MFLFKQGTTGNPKGATLSHHGILNNAYYVGEILNYENQVIFFVGGRLQVPSNFAMMLVPPMRSQQIWRSQ